MADERAGNAPTNAQKQRVSAGVTVCHSVGQDVGVTGTQFHICVAKQNGIGHCVQLLFMFSDECRT